jgi:hypothetical protein
MRLPRSSSRGRHRDQCPSTPSTAAAASYENICYLFRATSTKMHIPIAVGHFTLAVPSLAYNVQFYTGIQCRGECPGGAVDLTPDDGCQDGSLYSINAQSVYISQRVIEQDLQIAFYEGKNCPLQNPVARGITSTYPNVGDAYQHFDSCNAVPIIPRSIQDDSAQRKQPPKPSYEAGLAPTTPPRLVSYCAASIAMCVIGLIGLPAQYFSQSAQYSLARIERARTASTLSTFWALLNSPFFLATGAAYVALRFVPASPETPDKPAVQCKQGQNLAVGTAQQCIDWVAASSGRGETGNLQCVFMDEDTGVRGVLSLSYLQKNVDPQCGALPGGYEPCRAGFAGRCAGSARSVRCT